ncbi:hypothetical protein [Streptomyces sp. JJ36]|uniref:hypothetical protein n=1 Tax=Streptomyces sp. JJ36 TaxID=2736645 RepID=UPI001F2BF9AF|nr:hypothetical protein [Streptomyces sp. JJ36]MCF6523107.1 hypothetical protein [Streptomyces sp. JJ36]
MKPTLTTRPVVAGLLALSLLGAGAAAATAAGDPGPGDRARSGAPEDRRQEQQSRQDRDAAMLPMLSAGPQHATVRQWEPFRIAGRTMHIVPGTSVTLQQKQGNRWVSLPASTVVKRDHTYVLRAKLGMKGRNTLRMASAGTMSRPFTVTVR